MKFFDDKHKEVHWYNRNWFFATTILIVVINIVLYATLGPMWQRDRLYDSTAVWEDFEMGNVLSIFGAAFSHANWAHVLLNMMCFAVVGFYLERRYGSLCLLLLVVVFAFTAPAMASHVKGNINHHGFSGVLFALYGFFFVDFVIFLVSLRKKKSLTTLIIGICVALFIYISMCFIRVDSTLKFFGWPYDLVHNMAHYTGFLIGLLVALLFFVCAKFQLKKKEE